MASKQVERETKYDATPNVVLPDLTGLVPGGGRVEQHVLRSDSVYFDTEAHDLLRRGVTLRCRSGSTDEGWQLKVPTGEARTEIRLEPTGTQTTVPEELTALVAGIRRGKPLRHIVTVRTDRTAHRVLDRATGWWSRSPTTRSMPSHPATAPRPCPVGGRSRPNSARPAPTTP